MKKLQRLSDNQYLVNVLSNTWTENIEEARVLRMGELRVTQMKLAAMGVNPADLKEIDA